MIMNQKVPNFSSYLENRKNTKDYCSGHQWASNEHLMNVMVGSDFLHPKFYKEGNDAR